MAVRLEHERGNREPFGGGYRHRFDRLIQLHPAAVPASTRRVRFREPRRSPGLCPVDSLEQSKQLDPSGFSSRRVNAVQTAFTIEPRDLRWAGKWPSDREPSFVPNSTSARGLAGLRTRPEAV